MLELKMIKTNCIKEEVCDVCGYDFLEAGVSLVLIYQKEGQEKNIGVACPECLQRAERWKKGFKLDKIDFESAIRFRIHDCYDVIDEKGKVQEKLQKRISKLDSEIDFWSNELERLEKIDELTEDKPAPCPTLEQYKKAKSNLEITKLIKNEECQVSGKQ